MPQGIANGILISYKKYFMDHKDNFVKQIPDQDYVLIDGKQHPVRPYWPLMCHRCQNSEPRASECPQKPLTDQRLI